ncbi:hypothetical protein AK812_SmicGene20330, partial [Symbiodinium microadriaticum]
MVRAKEPDRPQPLRCQDEAHIEAYGEPLDLSLLTSFGNLFIAVKLRYEPPAPECASWDTWLIAREAGDVPWDWQAETTVADREESCGTDESMGIYAALSSGPLDPAHLPVARSASSAPPDGIWFLLFAPDRRPEHIWIVAQAPYTWDEAAAALAADPPLAFSSSFSHFWVLHEGGAKGIDADYHAIDNVYGFQEFVADTLQFAQHRYRIHIEGGFTAENVEVSLAFPTTLAEIAPIIQDDSLRIASSSPRVFNVAVDGFPCRSVVSVSEGPPQGSPTLHWVLLDARALFMSWRSLPAPHGQISCRGVIDDLLREIGSGWRLWLRDVPFSADLLETREGQILTVEVIHERIVPPQGSIEVSDEAIAAPVEAATAPSATSGPADTEPASAAGPRHGAQYEAEDTTVIHARADDGRPDLPEDPGPDARVPVTGLDHATVPFLILKQNYDHEWVTVRLTVGVDIYDALNAAAAARYQAIDNTEPDRTMQFLPRSLFDGDVVTLAFRQSDTANASSDHAASDDQPAHADEDEEVAGHLLSARRMRTSDLGIDGPLITLLEGHSDHPWNDLADYVAKDASRGDDLHELMMTVESGGMLAQAGAPDALRQVVKDIHLHTWFVSRFSDGTQVCSSLAGSRPGESWADLIYAYIYGRVLSKIHEYAVAEDLTFRVSHDPTAGVFPATDPTGFVDATDATWADDSAFPLIAEDPDSLMQKTRRLCTLVISFCEGHGMAPNLKPGKTSVMISLKGKGHHKARQKYFPNGTKKLELPDLGVGIVVADCYKHLGGYVDCKLSMKQEVRHRLAQASSSYDSARTLLLGNPRLELATRAALFESAVTPTFFNIGLWVPHGPSWDSLCNGYSKLVRRMLVPNVGAHRAFHVPLPVVHWYTGCWRLELIARRARFSLLVSLVQTGPPLLWAMLQAESTWLQTIQEDLRWLVRGDEEDWPLLAAPAWPAWHHIVNSSPQAFRRRIKRRLRQAHQEYISEDSILVCLWHCYRTVPRLCSEAMPPMQWFCHICRRSFCSKAGLSVHFFKKHGRVAAYRHVADGTTCAACDTSFWTVGRLAAHLRASPGCVAALAGRGHFVERPAPGFGSRKRRQADSLDFTLSLPDRRGSIHPRPEGPVWGKEQKQAYHDACDVVLEIDGPAPVVDIPARISAILFQGPLYYDELLLILDRLSSDVIDLHRDDPSDPWAPNTVHNILSALEHIKSSLGAPGLPDIQSIPECHSLMAFKQLVTTFEWPKATAPISSADGTLSPKTFSVLSRWEADWRQHCGRVEISAVADDYGVLLPTQLRQAWHHIIGGCTVLLDAPPEFWSHPLAVDGIAPRKARKRKQ